MRLVPLEKSGGTFRLQKNILFFIGKVKDLLVLKLWLFSERHPHAAHLENFILPVRYIPLLRSGYPADSQSETGALICGWHLHNARIQQRHNGTSVIRGPVIMKTGR